LTNQLAALTSKVEQLTTQNTELKATIQTLKSNRNTNNNNNRNRRDNGNYCWTHGYKVGNKHNSMTAATLPQDIARKPPALTLWVVAKPTSPRTDGQGRLKKAKLKLEMVLQANLSST
jgi:hypothetical protein